MNHPDQQPSAVAALVPFASRTLNLTANRTIDPDQTRLCFRLIVAALMRLPEPADVSFHYEALDGETFRFACRLDFVSESAAEHIGTTARTIIRAIAPWLDVAAPQPPTAFAPGDMTSVRFAVGTEEILSASATASFLWTAVSQGSAPARFSIALQRLILPQADDEEVRVRAEATLWASRDSIEGLAALAGVDAAQKAALRVISNDETSLEGELLADIPTIARLLAGPFTIAAFGSQLRTLTVPELGDMFAGAVPPHALVIGASGQGKSTMLDNAIDEAFRRGSAVVVVCPHGDLAKRAASTALRHDVEPIVYDFGDDCRHLRWNLTRPDIGMRADEWARRFSEVIRHQLWDDMPSSYFGPVMTRALPIMIETLASDPDGPLPLTRLPDLLDPTDSTFREGLLERIGNDGLTRALNTEVMPMILQRDAGNSSIWIISKLDPLIGDPTVRRIIETEHADVTMQPVLAGRSIIVSLPQSALTESGASALGALLLERLWAGVRARSVVTQPIEVFVDEWHKLPSPAISQMLAEGRKFGVRLRLANQHLGQLTTAQRESALANTGLLGAFRIGDADAATLDRRFPTVPISTMQQLPKHTVAFTTGEDDGVARLPPPAQMNEADFQRLAALHLVDDDDDHDNDERAADAPPARRQQGSLDWLDRWIDDTEPIGDST